MEVERRHVGPGFVGWWVLATTVGGVVALLPLAVGYVALIVVMSFEVDLLAFAIPVLALVVAALVYGIAQWLVLRRHMPQSGAWVWASALGFAVGGAMAIAAFWAVREAVFEALGGPTSSTPEESLLIVLGYSRDDHEVQAGVVAGAVSGAVFGTWVGIMQWFVLRGRFRPAGWWILASTVGAVVCGVFFGELLDGVVSGGGVRGSDAWTTALLGWVVFSLITGISLVWLLHQPTESHFPTAGHHQLA